MINLNIWGNKFSELPPLPNNLKQLSISSNLFTEMPPLPDSLEDLYCYNNPWTLPLDYKIIQKYI
jgi:Leucine-rich repeat (LRR) protein